MTRARKKTAAKRPAPAPEKKAAAPEPEVEPHKFLDSVPHDVLNPGFALKTK